MKNVLLSPGARIQVLSPAIIAILITIFATGAFSLVVAAYPVQLSDLQWRYQFLKSVLSSGPQIAFLMMMIMLTGIHNGQLRAVRGAAITSLLLAVALIGAAPLFALDVLSARHLQAQNAVGHFLHEGLGLAVSSIAIGVVLVFAGRRGLAATQVDPDQRKVLGADLVVAQVEPPR